MNKLITIEGLQFNLRFDLGTARVLKRDLGVDITVQDSNRDGLEFMANVFVAAYLRFHHLNRIKVDREPEEIKDYFYALTMEQAQEINGYFIESITAKKPADNPEAIKGENAQPAEEGKNL